MYADLLPLSPIRTAESNCSPIFLLKSYNHRKTPRSGPAVRFPAGELLFRGNISASGRSGTPFVQPSAAYQPTQGTAPRAWSNVFSTPSICPPAQNASQQGTSVSRCPINMLTRFSTKHPKGSAPCMAPLATILAPNIGSASAPMRSTCAPCCNNRCICGENTHQVWQNYMLTLVSAMMPMPMPATARQSFLPYPIFACAHGLPHQCKDAS